MNRTSVEARAPRMEPLARLPVFFALSGKRAVVAGGTPAAAWKAELLSAAGANVSVFAPVISDEMFALAADPPAGPVILQHRRWQPDDLPGAAVAVGAFAHDDEAARFAAA